MRKLTFLLACLFLVGVGLVNAQSRTVTGKVIYAEDEQPVIGAYVVVQGSSKGTVTDAEGNFSISVPQETTILEFSFLGLKTVQAEARNGMVVRMEQGVSELDEVMVVAFGTATKKSFTGSAAVIKEEDIVKRQTSDVTNSLAGQIAGVQGLSSNGQPGTGSTIRIRGVGSMSASNAPLYVVDGIPYDSDISALNNSDIESVTVLKDASSSALYGARGANGVIIITTKKGKSKDAQVNVDAKWGSNSRAVPAYSVMTDPAMYYETFYQALYNMKAASGSKAAHDYANKNLLDASQGGLGYLVYTVPTGQRLIGNNFKLNPNATLGYTDGTFTYLPDDWYQELFKSDNLRQEYNVNVSGSTDKLSYYASMGKLDDTGIIENSDFSRLSARVNADYQAKKWLKIGTNMAYSKTDSKYPDEQTEDRSSGNLFFLTSNIAPIYPLYIRDAAGKIMTDANGYTMYDYGDARVNNAKRPFMSQSNPASAIELNQEFYESNYLVGKWFATAEIINGLKLTANYGIASANESYHYTLNPYYGQYAEMGGGTGVAQSYLFSENLQFLLNYVRKFGLHNLDVLAGYESYKYKRASLSGFKQKLYQPEVAELNNAILQPSTSSNSNYYATMGYLGRVLYDYDSKYFASISYRRDASSSFAPENRWGNFWSVGAAWDLSSESFMEGIDQVNLLKLKVSYGAQGNDKLLYSGGSLNLYPYLDQFEVSENNGQFATKMYYKGNKDITWETSYNFNTGVDFSLFEERFNGTVEVFSRRTEDMLYYKPVSPSLGYDLFPMNIGSVSNSGVELDLRGDIIKTNSLTWNVYANANFLKNKILALHEELEGEWISGSYIYKEGESMYNFYIREYAGVDPMTGSALWYKDQTDDQGTVTGRTLTDSWADATQYEQGDILPKVFGGFGTTLDVYGVDFSLSFAYQMGGRIYDNTYANLMHSGYSSEAGRNWHTDILDAWTVDNTNTDVPKVDANDQYANSTSTRFLISSDYLSLQNIVLGYTLPAKWLKNLKISKLRIYGVADNVALLSARKGLDPRQSFTTTTASMYTPIRSISGGISLTF